MGVDFRDVVAGRKPALRLLYAIQQAIFRPPLPLSAELAKSYEGAMLLQGKRLELPYELDIWAGPKVMLIEWDENDREVRCISFRPGVWEEEALSLR